MKLRVVWRPYRSLTIYGDYFTSLAEELTLEPDLLTKIKAMPRLKPISLEGARDLYMRRHYATDGNKRRFNWIMNNWVLWLSTKGYHIQLTGEEYDLEWEDEIMQEIKATIVKAT